MKQRIFAGIVKLCKAIARELLSDPEIVKLMNCETQATSKTLVVTKQEHAEEQKKIRTLRSEHLPVHRETDIFENSLQDKFGVKS